jgi:formylglycine-generating enzyme required for sulfatase activity
VLLAVGFFIAVQKRGRVRTNPTDGLTYVWIPPGSFTMGCSPGDTGCHDGETPTPHVERIANGFWLGQTEVTQAAWKKVNSGGSPSHFQSDRLPVENVDWNQASDYCKAIGGRLPTEKEWEYAARAGTTGARYGALDAIAWYYGNSGGATHLVGLKQANAYGLYDMLGNVWEWTSDNYDAGRKVVRGGSWSNGTGLVRASYRLRLEPSIRIDDVGFRCVGEFR